MLWLELENKIVGVIVIGLSGINVYVIFFLIDLMVILSFVESVND